ncbi:MAG: Eco57I restriction-modification methylase domain-containing protein [Candidatus Daviesbacteria bacterium]|nr:Eco57I restriction-modification methylase domain-containing protein [Candidatus Daviesbacteria bacterium]
MEELDTLSAQLLQLAANHNWQTAVETCKVITSIFGIDTDRFKLWQDPRIVAEASRFVTAFETVNNPAAYEARHSNEKAVEIKLYWMKKPSKTNLSWIAGAADNFEDSTTMQHKNVGIDLVVPESCDRVYIIVSNNYKLRVLELHNHLSITDREILTNVIKIKDNNVSLLNEKTAYHTVLWSAFNFEPINRKFYLELVEHFSILVHHLEKDLGRKPSVMFTTRLIGRLLFIWFLKKKNLVNANIDYFSVPDSEKQKEYYKTKLEKLFFEVLNTSELERNNIDKITPYLNGGLFDKSNTDFCGDPKLTFPNGYFKDLFETLNKYNFTVDESSPEFQHVAIDPEMLGRIFESLLAEQIDENTGNNRKKATGAFYTPREIVSYMCEQSLIEYLKTKITDSPERDSRIDELLRLPETIFRDQDQNKRDKWRNNLGKDNVIHALDEILILDPAVGSGAFPMGMLHLLVKVYSRLDPKFEKDVSGLKRAILSRSLYGVDIEQTAIEITRLRAWLSIIVDIPDVEKVEPLPNLEFKFVCANTLIPLDDNKQATFFTDHDFKDKLITIRDDYFKTSSKIKKEKLQKDYLKLTQQEGFFDNKKTQQLKSYKPFDISSSSEFYDPELMHGVQAFDIVIGNPPYVRVSGIHKTYDNFIRDHYVTVFGNYDMYVPFLERAFNLSKKAGLISYITPNKYLTKRYGNKLRPLILKNFKIYSLLDLSQIKIFETASVYSLVSIFKKELPEDNYFVNVKSLKIWVEPKNIEWNKIKQSNFLINKNQIFDIEINNEERPIFDKIESNCFRLGEISKVLTGTPAISLYYEWPKLINEFDGNLQNNQLKLINVSNVSRFAISWGGEIRVAKNKYRDAIITFDNSLIGVNKWDVFKINPKVTIKGTALKLTAAIDECGYANVSLYSIIFNDDEHYALNIFILGLLNSQLLNYWYTKKFASNNLSGNYISFNGVYLSQLPIPKLDNVEKSLKNKIESLVDQILTLKKQNKDADTKNLESQIDQLVYKLYDLTYEEVLIVDKEFKTTREDYEKFISDNLGKN